MVKIKYYGLIGQVAGCEEDNIKGAKSIQDVIKEIYTRYGTKFTTKVFAAKGKVGSFIYGILNDKMIDLNENTNQPVTDQDVLKIFSGVFGGNIFR